jgi:hypothetical protein
MDKPIIDKPKNYTTACFLTMHEYYNHVIDLFPTTQDSDSFQDIINRASIIDSTKSAIKILWNHDHDSILLPQYLLSANFNPEQSCLHIDTSPHTIIIKPKFDHDKLTEFVHIAGGETFFNNLQKIFEDLLLCTNIKTLHLTYDPLEVNWEATMHHIANAKSMIRNPSI